MPSEVWALLQEKLFIAVAISNALKEKESLVFQESNSCFEPTIHIVFDAETYSASMGCPPGDAYDWRDNEYYLRVGLPADCIDWQSHYGDYSFDEDVHEQQEINQEETHKFINERIADWINEVYDYFDE